MNDWIVRNTHALLLGPFLIFTASLMAPPAWGMAWLKLPAGSLMMGVALATILAHFVNWRRAHRATLAERTDFSHEVARVAEANASKRLKLEPTQRG
ncbi:MAG: hypothetical protein AAGE01_12930 [Pseudomonadota bacterium]